MNWERRMLKDMYEKLARLRRLLRICMREQVRAGAYEEASKTMEAIHSVSRDMMELSNRRATTPQIFVPLIILGIVSLTLGIISVIY